MIKLIVGALVGGILVFAWQTLSWTALHFHDKEFQKHTNQDSILTYLNTQFTNDGQYYLPSPDKNASMEEEMKKREGKPWAVITYHKEYNANMMGNAIRGLLSSIVAALFVCWILMKRANSSAFSTFLGTVLIGLVGYLFFTYSAVIWFSVPGADTYLVDAAVSWGLCGLWLSWWLNRK